MIANLAILSLLALPCFSKTQTVTVAGVKATMSNSAASAAAITCQQGSSLTYSIKTESIPGITLQQAQNYFNNWAADAPSTVRFGSTGSNAVGATRAWNVTDGALKSTATIRERLTSVKSPSSSSSNLEQQWQSTATESYNSGSLLFYAAYKDLTVGQASGSSVFLQYYQNVCASNQGAANSALPIILQDALTYWINGIKNGNPPPSSSSTVPPPSSTISLPPANPTGSTIACKSGQYLTYGISTQADPGVSLAQAQSYFRNWVATAPGTFISSSGSNGVGSTRKWTQTDSSLQSVAPISEVLTQIINPTSGNSNLELRWQINQSQGYYNGQLVLYQAFNDLTIGENSSGAVFFQYYTNVCANNQKLANQAIPTILMDSLNYWNART